jgi:uncharacterized protein YggU (UPF0235/DUF167 family)
MKSEMKDKPTDGKAALEEFTRTMQTIFRVPKSSVEEGRKPAKPKRVRKPHA